MKLKHKKIIKNSKQQPRIDVGKLKTTDIQEKYLVEVKNRYSVLMEENDVQQEQTEEALMEHEWKCLKESVQHASKLVPTLKQKARKPWMKDEILRKMDERKTVKTKNPKKYEVLNREIKNQCQRAKEEWLEAKCADVEEMDRKHYSKSLHEEVKEITGTSKKSNQSGGNIKSKDGTILFEHDEVLERWKEYIEELFEDTRPEKPQVSNLTGPPILTEEIEEAMRATADKKSPGEDGITTEMWKALGPFGLERLNPLFNEVYDTGNFPEDLTRSIFITLPKKPRATECGDYRTISLMPHITKIFLRVILNRIKKRINMEVGEEQFGFRAGCGTREGIFCLNTIAQKHIQVQKPLYVCFIDYAKAFDRVKHDQLIGCLEGIGIDGKDVRIITNLYWNQKAAIRLSGVTSEYTPIKRGVRQGCILSPLLFNVYTEFIFRKINDHQGISIGGRRLTTNLRCADDTALLSGSNENLQDLLDQVKGESVKMGLAMNVKKTKAMLITKDDSLKPNIVADGVNLENVTQFKYLGQTVTADGRNESEINIRIAMSKGRFQQMYRVFTSCQISVTLRLRLLNCYVYSMLLYGCETWTITKTLEKKIEACEMWMLRRIGKVSWTERKTNEEVLALLGTERSLLTQVKKRKLSFFGHTKRHDGLLRHVLEARIEGSRAVGRPQAVWTDNIKSWTGCSLAVCTRRAQDRELWRSISSQPPSAKQCRIARALFGDGT